MYSPGLLAGWGHSLGAARFRLATKLRGEAPPGTVRTGFADTLGEGMDGPWAGAKRTPPGPGEKARDGVGERESLNPLLRVCQNRPRFLASKEEDGLGETVHWPQRGRISLNSSRPFG